MSAPVFIGIDNGCVSGGIAVIGSCGSFIDAIPMPHKKYRNRNEVDIRRLHLWLSNVTHGNLSNAVYAIEEPNNSRTPSTAYSVASSFHSIRGFFETKLLPFERVIPQRWQKAMLGKVPKGLTKEYALKEAKAWFPNESFLASPRCKTPHEGIIDATLISLYLKNKIDSEEI